MLLYANTIQVEKQADSEAKSSGCNVTTKKMKKVLFPCLWGYRDEFLPEIILGSSTETWFPSVGCDEGCFSGWSGKLIVPDGTRAARSGGWSFPTGGLACKGIKKKYDD